MVALSISLFDGFHLTHTAGPGKIDITPSLQHLLAYLLIKRHRRQPRPVLAGLFWGDSSEERARNCLSTALWRLRNILEPEGIPKGTYLITTASDEIGFNVDSDHWLDVAAFEENLVPILTEPIASMKPENADRLENAVELYQGELLDGCYEDWAIRERERLRSLHLDGLIHLMGYYRHHQLYDRAVSCGCTILEKEPLREGIQRDVMRLFIESGQRERAITQYQSCCRVLDEELGIGPMEETRQLYQQILNGGCLSCQDLTTRLTTDHTPPEKTTGSEKAVQILYHAMKQLDRSSKELRHAIGLLESLIKTH